MKISARFFKYFRPLLDALRSTDKPMRPMEAAALVRKNIDVPPEDLSRTVASGRQTIFLNDIYWVRHYLVKAGLISNAKRGQWALTEKGRNEELSDEEIKGLYIRVRESEQSASGDADNPSKAAEDEAEIDIPAPGSEEEANYDLDDIIDEGCFLSLSELTDIANRWREKKNLILQGPPGTGKTWLAKRLGFAMIGSNDRETTRTRLRVVQFHPSLSYEDFVRGYRPTAEEKLALQDGVMMEAIDAARSEPDLPYVLVIEEINRGNPAQIFGEMLTLLESSKRHAKEAMELTYRRERGERVYVPENLYVVGTMNVADRSLALVDLALRRRFAFVSLEPAFNDAWRDWCKNKGLGDDLLQIIERRLNDLNQTIANATSLGPQFRIGHSFVTPEETVSDGNAWLKSRVKTEIIPLLEEYWYDAPDTARTESEKLLKGFS